jgi:hypothetical protein
MTSGRDQPGSLYNFLFGTTQEPSALYVVPSKRYTKTSFSFAMETLPTDSHFPLRFLKPTNSFNSVSKHGERRPSSAIALSLSSSALNRESLRTRRVPRKYCPSSCKCGHLKSHASALGLRRVQLTSFHSPGQPYTGHICT